MTPTPRDAAQRARVRLPDGVTGHLIGVTRNTGMAKIRCDNGRYRRLPASMLVLEPGER